MKIKSKFCYFPTFLILLSFFLIESTVFAKPDVKPLAENVADIGSKYYQFKTKKFVSDDSLRTYKVWLGVPNFEHYRDKNKAQRSIFMLDGNAVMSHLDEALLKKLAEHDAPVLVAIGYDTNLPFETASRALDYTPADLTTGLKAPDPRAPERMSGGSDDFKRLIQNEIAPWVENQTHLDPMRRALWGHSYGGLSVLDHLISSQYFSHYFVASPSLTWADHRMMQKIEKVNLIEPSKKHVILMEGDVKVENGQKQSANFDAAAIDHNRKVLSKLNEQGVSAKFVVYPNLKHGEMLKASLLDALKAFKF